MTTTKVWNSNCHRAPSTFMTEWHFCIMELHFCIFTIKTKVANFVRAYAQILELTDALSHVL